MTFVPAVIDAAPTLSVTSAAAPTTTGRMEIALAGGDRLIVDSTVDAGALSRVLKALSRR